jgi:hypothetical protein
MSSIVIYTRFCAVVQFLKICRKFLFFLTFFNSSFMVCWISATSAEWSSFDFIFKLGNCNFLQSLVRLDSSLLFWELNPFFVECLWVVFVHHWRNWVNRSVWGKAKNFLIDYIHQLVLCQLLLEVNKLKCFILISFPLNGWKSSNIWKQN